MTTYMMGKFIQEDDLIIDIGEDRILEITSILKNMKWEQIIHTQTKQYFLNDLCLTIHPSGKSTCEKTCVKNYQTSSNMMKCMIDKTELPEYMFPGLNKYHDTRILESVLFKSKGTTITCSNVVEYNTNIYYTCTINGILNTNLITLLGLDVSFGEKVYLEHGKYHNMSVL